MGNERKRRRESWRVFRDQQPLPNTQDQNLPSRFSYLRGNGTDSKPPTFVELLERRYKDPEIVVFDGTIYHQLRNIMHTTKK